MDTFEGILDVSCKELDKIARAGKYRSREDVELAYKLIDIIKDVYEVWDKEGSGDNYDHTYGMGYTSYARGRGRDSSRLGGRMYGYSRHGEDEFTSGLRELMDQAPDEKTRQSIQRMLDQFEQG